ncbi:UDP-2-acetamido-2-deoxy-ribo-hexuluronate aminotransferase [Geoalkalibacter ferrihydriticus]|uniref:Aminotransferase DegT n=2 Tax=Geoalkalibacter ferrihydriticus TaxID=392333 RepID=A0A0C2HFR8_9BACT|nr:DegT/DnrJ/EryC1/StrS family aminotransferase [Geoalkalibacter ferrihydriticus]KIH75766.1 aminotransferase DegT [Geoalkalibacter ferrihydriticus DSM 17813]SDM64091.1 UDP-2-acetamido-2-deoxy-ribo-hexuluronate aminotransferase [Geoalkalibacter ferrihydriticus]
MQFIDLKTQQTPIREDIEQRIKAVLDHGQYIMGPEVTELEQRLAQYVGARHCLGVSSGTDALLIAMMALGIGPGDEVVTSPFTFISTVETIALLGARPVFVDIEPRTYNLDPTLLEAALTDKTRAIMPVSLYGQCADFLAINAIAAQRGIPVIEDGAQSFGATQRGERSCHLSTIGCTSFFPSKPLGGYGDGGACFTDDDELAKRMQQIRVHGQDRRYNHPLIGVNGRLDTLQAAILLAKLDIFPDEVERRAAVAERYRKLLGDMVVVPFVEDYNTSVYAQYTIRVEQRDEMLAALAAQGVPTAVHYPVPLHRQPAFASLGYPHASFPHAEEAARQVMSLPMHPYLKEADQVQIAEAVKVAVNG